MIAPHIAKWALDKAKKSNDSQASVVAGDVAIPLDVPTKKRKKYTDERVLETKGGGSPPPPPQPTPQEQAAARDWEAQQEFEREQRRQERIDAQAKADKDAKDAAWQSSKGAAYTGALSSGANRLRSLGIEAGDPYGVYSQFTDRINSANAGIQQGGDYTSAFAPTILDEILGGARTQQRNKYRNEFNTQVSPYYAEEQFASTRDDPILASILESQYTDAMADLNAAKGRGQASQAVYDRALKDLGNTKATANTELQGIGGNILTGYQGDINRRRQSAIDQAAAWDFGTTFDPSGEAGRIQKYATERGAGLEGDIRGAIGGREFFDVNSLIGKAAARVGNQTTPTTTTGGTGGTNALYDTFQDQAQRDTTGNEGIF